MVKRVGLWFLSVLLLVPALYLGGIAVTWHAPDPALYPPRGDEPAVTIYVISHGYHTGIGLPRASVLEEAGRDGYSALINVATRFSAYPWIEVGWGEEEFYSHVPTADQFNLGLAFRALFRPGNASVMHVVGLAKEPPDMFPASEVVPVRLSSAGFKRLLQAVAASFDLRTGFPRELGPGLYGPSLFYRAVGNFHFANVCNHWTGRVLSAAGLGGSPFLSTFAPALMWELRRHL